MIKMNELAKGCCPICSQYFNELQDHLNSHSKEDIIRQISLVNSSFNANNHAGPSESFAKTNVSHKYIPNIVNQTLQSQSSFVKIIPKGPLPQQAQSNFSNPEYNQNCAGSIKLMQNNQQNIFSNNFVHQQSNIALPMQKQIKNINPNVIYQNNFLSNSINSPNSINFTNNNRYQESSAQNCSQVVYVMPPNQFLTPQPSYILNPTNIVTSLNSQQNLTLYQQPLFNTVPIAQPTILQTHLSLPQTNSLPIPFKNVQFSTNDVSSESNSVNSHKITEESLLENNNSIQCNTEKDHAEIILGNNIKITVPKTILPKKDKLKALINEVLVNALLVNDEEDEGQISSLSKSVNCNAVKFKVEDECKYSEAFVENLVPDNVSQRVTNSIQVSPSSLSTLKTPYINLNTTNSNKISSVQNTKLIQTSQDNLSTLNLLQKVQNPQVNLNTINSITTSQIDLNTLNLNQNEEMNEDYQINCNEQNASVDHGENEQIFSEAITYNESELMNPFELNESFANFSYAEQANSSANTNLNLPETHTDIYSEPDNIMQTSFTNSDNCNFNQIKNNLTIGSSKFSVTDSLYATNFKTFILSKNGDNSTSVYLLKPNQAVSSTNTKESQNAIKNVLSDNASKITPVNIVKAKTFSKNNKIKSTPSCSKTIKNDDAFKPIEVFSETANQSFSEANLHSNEYSTVPLVSVIKLESGESNSTHTEESLSLKASESLPDSESDRGFTPSQEISQFCLSTSFNQHFHEQRQSSHTEIDPNSSKQVVLSLDASCSIYPANSLQPLSRFLKREDKNESDAGQQLKDQDSLILPNKSESLIEEYFDKFSKEKTNAKLSGKNYFKNNLDKFRKNEKDVKLSSERSFKNEIFVSERIENNSVPHNAKKISKGKRDKSKVSKTNKNSVTRSTAHKKLAKPKALKELPPGSIFNKYGVIVSGAKKLQEICNDKEEMKLRSFSPLASTSGVQHHKNFSERHHTDEEYELEYESDCYADPDGEFHNPIPKTKSFVEMNSSINVSNRLLKSEFKVPSQIKREPQDIEISSPNIVDKKPSKKSVKRKAKKQNKSVQSSNSTLVFDVTDIEMELAEDENGVKQEFKIKTESLDSSFEEKYSEYFIKKACTDIYFTNLQLKNEENAQMNEIKKEFVCKVCTESFSSQSLLALHTINSLKSRWICPICHFSFSNAKERKDHVGLHNLSDYKCPICSLESRTFYSWAQHKLFHMGLVIYECKICGQKCKKSTDIITHIKKHEDDKQYECMICTLRFITLLSYRRHLTKHKHEKDIKCDLCGKIYKNFISLRKHRLKSHSIRMFRPRIKTTLKRRSDYMCRICNEIFKTPKKLNWHKETHERWPKKCHTCGDSFVHTANLTKHIRLKHNSEFIPIGAENCTVACKVCSKVYKSSSIRQHMRVHSGLKPYKCSVCNKEFSVKCNFLAHKWVHLGIRDRPFKCKICEKSFHLSKFLDVHMRSHKKVRPYTCNECGKAFLYKSNYSSHIKLHLNEKPHECSHCGKTFHRKYNLITHMRIHTGETPYECTACGKEFTQKSNYNVHMKAFHVVRQTIREEI